jgi:hypothetical protein
MLGELIGSGLGSALGGVSDVLSAPRRMLWNGVAGALGTDAPDSGSELLGRLGMDKDSMLTHALGFGVEAMTDPMTYAGGLLGRLTGRGLGAITGAGKAAAATEAASPLVGRLERMAGGGFNKAPKIWDKPLEALKGGIGGFDQAALRADQLNSPFFRPDLPVFNLGTPEFSQIAAPTATSIAGRSPLSERLARMAAV